MIPGMPASCLTLKVSPLRVVCNSVRVYHPFSNSTLAALASYPCYSGLSRVGWIPQVVWLYACFSKSVPPRVCNSGVLSISILYLGRLSRAPLSNRHLHDLFQEFQALEYCIFMPQT